MNFSRLQKKSQKKRKQFNTQQCKYKSIENGKTHVAKLIILL